MARKKIEPVEVIATWFQTAPLEAAETLLTVATGILKGRRGPEVVAKPQKRRERAFKGQPEANAPSV